MESDVNQLLRGQLERQKPRDNTVRVYLASTFMDMEVERRALHANVFPKVRSLCQDKGLEFQVVDFEDPSVSSTEQCELNIFRPLCEPIVMVLLGERYGPPSLPLTIRAKEFKRLSQTAQELTRNPQRFLQTLRQIVLPPLFEELSVIHRDYLDNIELLQSLYMKDTNTVPSSYILKDGPKNTDTNLSEDKIQMFFCTIATVAYEGGTISEEAKDKYFKSALDILVTRLLKSSKTKASGVICVQRQFTGLKERIQNYPTKTCREYVDLVDIKGSSYIDSNLQERIEDLKKRLDLWASTKSYTLDWSGAGVNAKFPKHEQYLERMCEEVERTLIGLVNTCETRSRPERRHSDTKLLREVRRRGSTTQQFTKMFCVHGGVLAELEQKIKASSCPLLIHGPTGSGKTGLIGELLDLFPQWFGMESVRIALFLGTSDLTKDLRTALRNICDRLSRMLFVEQHLTTSPDIPDALECMVSFSAKIKKPILIALDAIDELSPVDASNVLCLLSQKLPNNVKFVISVTSCVDSFNSNAWWDQITWKFHHADQCIKVPPFSTESSLHVLNQRLKNSRRCLSAYQRDRLVSTFNQCPIPMFIKLSVEEASLWSSFTKFGRIPKTQTLRNLIERTVERLEEAHGRVLVSMTCCYITASNRGLSCVELGDILFLDGQFPSVFSSPRDRNKVPSFCVLKLLRDLQPLLSASEEGGGAVLTWSHKCIRETIRERYIPIKDLVHNRSVHKLMADYWMGQKTVGVRKLVELPFHILQAGEMDSFDDSLLNFEWILSKYDALAVDSLVDDFHLASTKQENRGYLEIERALVACKGAVTREDFLKQLEFQLLPPSQKYPGTVGKLAREIETQTDRANTFICCGGPQPSDHHPVEEHNQKSASRVDPPLQSVTYNSDKSILVGLAKDGRIGVMDLAQEICSWSYFPFEGELSGSKCTLSKDGSMLVVFGCRLVVIDMVRKTPILIREPSSGPFGVTGKYINAVISKDNQRIVAEESITSEAFTMHAVDLNGTHQKYHCLPFSSHYTENIVVFGTTMAGTGPSNRFRLMKEVTLSEQRPTRELSLENEVRDSDILCMGPTEEQIAAISLESPTCDENKSARCLTVKLFARKEDKLIKSYQTDVEDTLDCAQNDLKARFLTSGIVLFISSSTWKLDLVTGELTEMLPFGLIKPVFSKDGSHMAGILKESAGSSQLCIVSAESSDVLVKFDLPAGVGVDFQASSNLDTFVFFVKGMSLPVVFVASKSLRRAMNLDEDGFRLPVFSSTGSGFPGPRSPVKVVGSDNQQIQDNGTGIVVERISPTLLIGHPSPRPKTLRGQHVNGDLIRSSANTSGEEIEMVEVCRDDIGTQGKAYFAKAHHDKTLLMKNNSASIRLRKMNFDHTEVTTANSELPDRVSFKDDSNTPMETENTVACKPSDKSPVDPKTVNKGTKDGSDSESVVSSSTGSSFDSLSDSEFVVSSVSKGTNEKASSQILTESRIGDKENPSKAKELHDSSSGSGSRTDSGSESGLYTSEASKSGNEDHLPISVRVKEADLSTSVSEGKQVTLLSELTDNEPNTTQSMTTTSDLGANYMVFTSSESEGEYDGEDEDNTEGDLHDQSKSSDGYNAAPSTSRFHRLEQVVPMDTTEDSDDSDQPETGRDKRSPEITTPRRPVLLQRKNTSKNYFLSDDDEDNPETIQPTADRCSDSGEEFEREKSDNIKSSSMM